MTAAGYANFTATHLSAPVPASRHSSVQAASTTTSATRAQEATPRLVAPPSLSEMQVGSDSVRGSPRGREVGCRVSCLQFTASTEREGGGVESVPESRAGTEGRARGSGRTARCWHWVLSQAGSSVGRLSRWLAVVRACPVTECRLFYLFPCPDGCVCVHVAVAGTPAAIPRYLCPP